MARALSRPGVARNPRIPADPLAPRDVLSVHTVADRCAVAARAPAHARARHVRRAVSRPGIGYRPFRIGSLGPPPLLYSRLPRGLAARRFFTSRPGLGI